MIGRGVDQPALLSATEVVSAMVYPMKVRITVLKKDLQR